MYSPLISKKDHVFGGKILMYIPPTVQPINLFGMSFQHFVGERRIDEDLGKTTRFTSDQEKMLEVLNRLWT